MATPTVTKARQIDDDELIEAVLSAGRLIVSAAVQSLHELSGDVTFAQHRVMVELNSRGPQRVADLAEVLAVDRSTASRMCDRLVRKRLASRRRLSSDRRAVRIALTAEGQALVSAVDARRRDEVSRAVRQLADEDRGVVMHALEAFAALSTRSTPIRTSAMRHQVARRPSGTAPDRAAGW